MKTASKAETAFTLLIGTLILSIIGFYNGYPLVYSDTGTYIHTGFEGIIPLDRPLAYGLFIKAISFGYSAWYVIIVQNFLTAFVIYQVFRLFPLSIVRFRQIYFSSLLVLVLFTGIGWYSNQLMPDFFTPICILSIFVLLRANSLSLVSKILLTVILIYSLITHFSHLLLGSGLIIIMLMLRIRKETRWREISLRRLTLIGIVVFSGWLILPAINYLAQKEFVLSKGSHVFMMGHLVDTGILKKFLNDKCGDEAYQDLKLCQYKDNLPIDAASFVWEGETFINTGGWLDSKEEYDRIVKATLTDPKYLTLNVYRSFTYGLIQLARNDIGEGLSPYPAGSSPHNQIQWRFSSESNNYLNSKQNKWNGVYLDLANLNTIQTIIIILCLLFILLMFPALRLEWNTTSILLLVFVLWGIVLNSFITAGLNTPYERYQARVIWLLPLAVILFLIANPQYFRTVLNRPTIPKTD